MDSGAEVYALLKSLYEDHSQSVIASDFQADKHGVISLKPLWKLLYFSQEKSQPWWTHNYDITYNKACLVWIKDLYSIRCGSFLV